MQVRRALIAFALVFAAVTAVSVISASREEDDGPAAPPPAPRPAAATTVEVAFRHPVQGVPPVRDIPTGSHVVITVQAAAPGNVEIADLGLLQPVGPGTPAVFDVLADRPGRYDVSLLSVAREGTKLGTLAVGN